MRVFIIMLSFFATLITVWLIIGLIGWIGIGGNFRVVLSMGGCYIISLIAGIICGICVAVELIEKLFLTTPEA